MKRYKFRDLINALNRIPSDEDFLPVKMDPYPVYIRFEENSNVGWIASLYLITPYADDGDMTAFIPICEIRYDRSEGSRKKETVRIWSYDNKGHLQWDTVVYKPIHVIPDDMNISNGFIISILLGYVISHF
jgi:hypothetical protein